MISPRLLRVRISKSPCLIVSSQTDEQSLRISRFNLHWSSKIITARKQRLGQGNVFTPAYDSVIRGRGSPWQRAPDRDPLERDPPRQRPPWTGTPQTETPWRAGDTHPTGMHSCYHLILLYLFFKSENSTVSEWMWCDVIFFDFCNEDPKCWIIFLVFENKTECDFICY